MKLIRGTFIFLFIIYGVLFTYDLIDYDPNYVNRSNFFFDKSNLNSRYTKNTQSVFENLINKINHKFIWKQEEERKGEFVIDNEIISDNKNNFENILTNKNIPKIENWRRSNLSNNSERFSFLKNINFKNIDKLEPAWIYRAKDGNKGIQANAIFNDGKLYFPTPGNKIVCLNAETGEEIWAFQGDHWRVAQRGLVLNKKENNSEFIYFTDNDKLRSINAKDGKPNLNFGKKGFVKIKPSVVTPVIYRDKIIVATFYPSIEVYDLNTGKSLWKYFFRNKGEKFKGGNPWGGISLDDNTGILYVTTGNPANYFIGVDRPGLNEYTNSLIAIDINKKKELWKFQETTHDLWNLDIPAAPILTTINFDDQLIDVVIAITKLGNTLIFDRANGSSLNDYISIPTRSSKIKGEMTSTKQKYFLKPPAFSKNNFLPKDVFSADENEKEKLKNFVKKNYFGIYPPFEVGKKTIIYNFHGGAEWTGASVDPLNGVMYVTANNIPWITEIYEEKSLFKFKYKNRFKRFLTQENLPASKPPWGTLSAINLNNREIIWQVPFGNYDNINLPDFPITGTENFGGATATASGIVFASGTLDKKIRAFNSMNGKEIWSYILPNVGSAPPTIYQIENDQYVFIPATGGNTLSGGYPKFVQNSDHYIAFKLKK